MADTALLVIDIRNDDFPGGAMGLEGAAVRQAADLGYKVTLPGDACATRAQAYAGEKVPAKQVHAAFLAALNGFYAKAIPTHEL